MEAGMTRNSVVLFVGVAALAGLLAGCRVEKTTNGDSKNVNIVTPFGSMHVKTNDADLQASIGLPVYPGAVMVRDDEEDNRSADVDMSFGGFQLHVKKVKYGTPDSPGKVEAFYRNGMKSFGDVIACRDNHAVGVPAQTSEGLTCDNGHNGHVTVDDRGGSNQMELKAGSKQHQHLVEIESDGSGTKFSLVSLDLPGKITYDGDDSNNGDKRQ
jgi:hypothetical protein